MSLDTVLIVPHSQELDLRTVSDMFCGLLTAL